MILVFLFVVIIAALGILLIGPGPAVVLGLLVVCGCLTAAGLSGKEP